MALGAASTASRKSSSCLSGVIAIREIWLLVPTAPFSFSLIHAAGHRQQAPMRTPRLTSLAQATTVCIKPRERLEEATLDDSRFDMVSG